MNAPSANLKDHVSVWWGVFGAVGALWTIIYYVMTIGSRAVHFQITLLISIYFCFQYQLGTVQDRTIDILHPLMVNIQRFTTFQLVVAGIQLLEIGSGGELDLGAFRPLLAAVQVNPIILVILFGINMTAQIVMRYCH